VCLCTAKLCGTALTLEGVIVATRTPTGSSPGPLRAVGLSLLHEAGLFFPHGKMRAIVLGFNITGRLWDGDSAGGVAFECWG
jgi:hypothetical protein